MGIKEFLQEDDAQQALKELNSGVRLLMRRVDSLEVLLAPKTLDRMFQKPFQRLLVPPGEEMEVYRQEVPRGYTGVITRIGNDWFPNTVLSRFIDNRTNESAIERVIAPVTDPMAVKIFAREEIIWRAKNNDAISHTFGILTDGFFLQVDDADRMIDLEG